MASIRNLKKNIKYLTEEIGGNALMILDFHGKEVEDKVIEILNEVEQFHNNMITKINNAPTGKKNPEVKKYFKQINQEIQEKYPYFLEKLSKIIAKN